MNKQTTIAFKTLKDIYGKPDWADNPQRKSIEEEWDKALGKYTEEQVRNACLRYAKFHNGAIKFPRLACIEAELVDEETNQLADASKKAAANRMYVYCLEHAQECNPVPSKLATQRAIWRIYQVAVDGYDPKADEGWWK